MNRTARIHEGVFRLGLSADAFTLYGVLLLHRNKNSGEAKMSRKTMLAMSNVAVNKLTDRLEELSRHGLVERLRKDRSNTNIYLVRLLDQNHDAVTLPQGKIGSQNHDGVTLVSESRCRDSAPRKKAKNVPKSESLRRDRNQLNQEKSTNSASLFFQTDAFKSAWQSWVKYRRELGKKLTPSTIERQLTTLGKMSEQEAIASIEQSIEQGWQGLFPPKQSPKKAPNGPYQTCSPGRD